MQPDLLLTQEVMVNGGGMDDFILRALSENVSSPYQMISEPSVLNFLRQCGAPPSYGRLVGTVLIGLVELQNMLLKIPILGRLIGRIPRWLEYPRIWIHKWFKYDLLKLYFPLYAPIWGISTFISPEIIRLENDSIGLATPEFSEHMGTVQRVKLQLEDNKTAWLVNVHLDATVSEEGREIRLSEMQLILNWMEHVKDDCDVTFIAGDNNTLLPGEPLFDLMRERGYFSAHHMIHGTEPVLTWPSGISCHDLIDVDGEPGCLDFIWVHKHENVVLHNAGVLGDNHCPNDKSLFPSDHFALFCDFSFTS